MSQKTKTTRRRRTAALPGMGYTAATTGIPLHYFKRWRRAGCPGFRPNNRVYLREIQGWLKANEPSNYRAILLLGIAAAQIEYTPEQRKAAGLID